MADDELDPVIEDENRRMRKKLAVSGVIVACIVAIVYTVLARLRSEANVNSLAYHVASLQQLYWECEDEKIKEMVRDGLQTWPKNATLKIFADRLKNYSGKETPGEWRTLLVESRQALDTGDPVAQKEVVRKLEAALISAPWSCEMRQIFAQMKQENTG